MELFTYHKKGTAIRSHVQMLLTVGGFELLVWAVVIPVLPRPWNLAVLALVLGVSGLILAGLFSLLRNPHRLDGRSLTLGYSRSGMFGKWSVRLPLAEIAGGASLAEALPRGLAPGIVPEYRSDDDTLYLLADRRGLVAIELNRPVESRLVKQGTVQFARVVLSLDEPERFLAALAGAGVPVAGLGSGSGAPAEPGAARAGAPAAPGAARAGAPAAPGAVAPDAPGAARAGAPAEPGAAPRPPMVTAAPHSAAAAIQLDGLTKRFGDFAAVRPISLSVAPGEILAFLGSNGAGKTTTIRMMTGLLRPTAGHVLIGGHDVWGDGPAARRLLGYVPDVPLLYEGLTAREFLWLMAGLHDLPTGEGRRRADELLRLLGMERWGDHLIRPFSLGMKRKMAIAAALIHRPQVLLLDEVTNGLDPRASREVKDLIAGAARTGATVFLTTHLLDVAQELAHRIAIIHGGELRALGTLAELREQAALPGANLEELFLALTEEHARAEVSAR